VAILVYGIIDSEYKTWFARKCVVVFQQLQSRINCCVLSPNRSNNRNKHGNPLNINQLCENHRGRKPAANNSAEEVAAKVPVSPNDLHDTLELGRCDDRYSSNDTDKRTRSQ
jgi:hypothetical protein